MPPFQKIPTPKTPPLILVQTIRGVGQTQPFLALQVIMAAQGYLHDLSEYVASGAMTSLKRI
jgi:hypothetical protein